jgi:hypothetical protein
VKISIDGDGGNGGTERVNWKSVVSKKIKNKAEKFEFVFMREEGESANGRDDVDILLSMR